MFGLSFEKLFLVAIIAGFVLGPQRLPGYAHQLAQYVRTLRRFVDTTRSAAERDMGIPLKRTEWEPLNLRQYDPRRIVSDALQDPAGPSKPIVTQQMIDDASRVRPGQKYLVTGTSSHPHRILITSLPEDDPRRIAARVLPAAEAPIASASALGESVECVEKCSTVRHRGHRRGIETPNDGFDVTASVLVDNPEVLVPDNACVRLDTAEMRTQRNRQHRSTGLPD